ncbi:MAG: hypothetical protein PHY02_10960 [Phycisphaerae bacterium]|nr:hypothetical protein [Phycisphaerae bacterium]
MKSLRYVMFLIVVFLCVPASAQFVDDFNALSLAKDPQSMKGWAFFTGDGAATVDFQQGNGFASIMVDATKDKRGIWWAVIKRCVSADLDLSLVEKTGYEFRIEAQIRVSNAPRRVNLSLNTQRTTDYHSNLMEFDIPDTNNWHTISMTTKDFDAKPGDNVFGQLALMDWGIGKYSVDVNYFRVDIVEAASAGSDKGVQLPYRPPIPDPNTFENVIKAAQDSMVDAEYPEINFNNWNTVDSTGKVNLLNVNGTQWVIMRWDLNAFAGKKVAGSGLLELTTWSMQKLSEEIKDFGQVRIVEILGGDPDWNQQSVTFDSLCNGQPIDEVFNSQMVIDIGVNQTPGGKTLITISNPVLQRMVDGRTLGLLIRPLGAINASFYSMENQAGKFSPTLRFNLQK